MRSWSIKLLGKRGLRKLELKNWKLENEKLESDNFIISGNLPKDILYLTAFYLEETLEAHKKFFRVENVTQKYFVRVFHYMRDYEKYHRRWNIPLGSEAYYHTRKKKIIMCYEPLEQDPLEYLRTLIHEFTHQFLYLIYKEIPEWLSEGLAEYFSTSILNEELWIKRRFIAGGKSRRHIIFIRRALEKKKIPRALKRLLRMDRLEFDGRKGHYCYAYSWVLVHYLIKSKRGGIDIIKLALEGIFDIRRRIRWKKVMEYISNFCS